MHVILYCPWPPSLLSLFPLSLEREEKRGKRGGDFLNI